MFCRRCGGEIANGASFCHKCGEKIVYVDKSIIEEKTISSDCSDVTTNDEATLEQPEMSADNEIPNELSYGETIKPYYREQFDRIASGQKAKFNWIALLFPPIVQLYNGCYKIFYRTSLPIYIALFILGFIEQIAVLQFNFSLISIIGTLSTLVLIGGLIVAVLNGFKFNEWYYQDVINNLGKKRTN